MAHQRKVLNWKEGLRNECSRCRLTSHITRGRKLALEDDTTQTVCFCESRNTRSSTYGTLELTKRIKQHPAFKRKDHSGHSLVIPIAGIINESQEAEQTQTDEHDLRLMI